MNAKARQRNYVGLLRGINVGGRNKIPMAKLCALCTSLGWREVRHYIQSGNLVFSASAKESALEATLERAIKKEFGFSIPVIVRAAEAWPDYLKSNPFPQASAKEPNRVALAFCKAEPGAQAGKELQARAAEDERVRQVGPMLWFHFGNGAGNSKLSTALLDRVAGSPVTMRNWRTVLKIAELLGVPDEC